MISRQALPTARQLEWADCEIGVIIHLDVQTFEPGYGFRERWGYTPSPSVFDPKQLDTDQWILAAKSAGAKYAVLVAKHCSGFSLWPTKAHSYSVASSPWKGGRGDLVGDFFKSCECQGLKPGLYCSASCNAFMNVDNPGLVRSGDLVEQARYNRVVETQLEELWSNYGEVFEIWFDGGVLPPEKGGPSIIPIMKRLQPGAVVFQGPADWPSLLRWVGNERGEAPYPCWASTKVLSSEDGTTERSGFEGSPDGSFWAPAESDMPNRDQRKAFQGGWFWRKGEDCHLYSLEHLVERYFLSVGRNTNLLLGMVVDDRGLVPDADVARFAEFGSEVAKLFGRRLAKASGNGAVLELPLPPGSVASKSVIMEDIAKGERIREYSLDALVDGSWTRLASGSSVGHKRIERFAPVAASKLRLSIGKSVGEPSIRELSAFA